MTALNDCLQYAILAPQEAGTPRSSMNVSRDRSQHTRLLGEMQRLRGRVALQEKAITPSMLDSSGRHVMQGDEKGWHLLRVRGDGKVVGCARILVHPRDVIFQGLRIAASSVARCTAWAAHVRNSVESDLRYARINGLRVIEPGGWVIDESLRGTKEAVSIAINAFALSQLLGDCIGYLTATVKNHSSTILHRLGGRSLEAQGTPIPRFFEPAWGCDMELLRFDTNSLNPRFGETLESARSGLLSATVYYAEAPSVQTPQFALAACA
jgi:hypothetical protein